MPQEAQVKAIVKRPPGKAPGPSTLPIEKRPGGGVYSLEFGAYLKLDEPTFGGRFLKEVKRIGTSGRQYLSGVFTSIRNSARTPEERAAAVAAELFGTSTASREMPEA